MQTVYFPFRPTRQPAPGLTQKIAEQQDLSLPGISVHQLVNQLMKELQPLAIKRSNVILNGISRELMVAADENMLAFVLWNLISSAVNSTKNECIHIVGLCTEDGAMLHIKNVGAYFYQTISHEYRKVLHMVEKMGGSLHLDDNNGSHISFSFSCNKPAA